MDNIVLRWIGWKLGYEGRPGWPAKDLTQKELDDRGLDKARMLAYRPKLYEEVLSEVEEVEPAQMGVDQPIQPAQPTRKGKRGKKETAADTEDAVAEPVQAADSDRRTDSQVQPGKSPDDDQGHDDGGGRVGEGLPPGTGEPGED